MTNFELKCYLENFPPEIKLMIMRHLSQEDLCNVALTSKIMKTAALDTSLWNELTITFSPLVIDKLKKKGAVLIVLNFDRFKNIKSLKLIDNMKKQDKNLEKLKKNQIVTIIKQIRKVKSLKKLTLDLDNLKGIPMSDLRVSISQLETVDLRKLNLSTNELQEIMEEATQSNSLTELNLGSNKMGYLSTNLLCKAIAKLKGVNLFRSFLDKSSLPTEQLVNILEEVTKSNTLEVLYLIYSDLEDVPTQLLSKALSKLKKVILYETNLSNRQIVAILEKTLESNSLQELNWTGLDMKDVPVELLSKIQSKLKSFGTHG